MSRYSDISILKNQKVNNGKLFYSTVRYPEIPLSPNDIYVITVEGDKLDVLAQQFYNNKELWWIISIANTDLTQNSLFIPVGTQLRIPTNIQSILAEYDTLNN